MEQPKLDSTGSSIYVDFEMNLTKSFENGFHPIEGAKSDEGRDESLVGEGAQTPPMPISIPQMPRPGLPLSESGRKKRGLEYPLVFLSPTGIINVILREEIVIMIAINKTLRVCCPGKFSVASSGVEPVNVVNHPQASIMQRKDTVSAKFTLGHKYAVVGPDGVVFSMKNQTHVINHGELEQIPNKQIKLESMKSDETLSLFYQSGDHGVRAVPLCAEIVQSAIYESRGERISVHINGIHILQSEDGDVHISCRPRQIHLSPRNGTVSVQAPGTEISIQTEQKGFVKQENKRVHVSRSGMVVSDGVKSVGLDCFGRIIY